MKSATLAQRLFFRVSPTILVIIACIGLLAFESATRKINSVYDAQLIDNGGVLWMMEADDFAEGEKLEAPKEINSQSDFIQKEWAQNEDADDYADARMFRIWKDGKIVVYSDTTLPATVVRQRDGFSNVVFNGVEWRIYSLSVPAYNVHIEVGEKLGLRHALVNDILFDLFMPLLFLIPVIGILIWLGIGNGLSTVRALVQQIRIRSPDNLSPVNIPSLPHDLEPLASSINQLLAQLDRSLSTERHFSDHAAHQLRTPLAGIRLQLQMLADADSAEERKTIIDNLLTGNARAAKLVGQLLTMARISHEPLKIVDVPLYQTLASVIAEFGPLADQKSISISLTGDETATIKGDETMLQLMASNIIDNALKYTPQGGEVWVDISTTQNNKWRVSISDTGPGIAEEHRILSFQRFYRVDSPKEDGSGLGLAIVNEIVQRLSGEISLKVPSNGRGLLVEFILPRA